MHEIQDRRKCNENKTRRRTQVLSTEKKPVHVGFAQSLEVRLEIFQFGQTLNVHSNLNCIETIFLYLNS